MPTLVRLWFSIVIGAAVLHASDVAVVVDVSGTMGRYGKWQSEVLDLIEALTTGSPTAGAKFTSTGAASTVGQFKLAAGEAITLLKFGSVQSDAFPFFANAQKVASAAELRGVFPTTAAAFKEKQTNKELAIAVGARLAGNSPARMIVISDFLSDADVSEQQQQYVNQFQSQSKLETPIIYTWLTDKRVMVKLMVANTGTTPPLAAPAEAPKVDHTVQILEARAIDGGKHQFRWRLTPAAAVKSYRLTIRDVKTRKIVVEQPGLAAPAVVIATPPPGDYFAQVTADLEDGAESASRPYPLKVEGSYGGVLLALAALAAIVGGLWFFMRRANKQKADPNKRREDVR